MNASTLVHGRLAPCVHDCLIRAGHTPRSEKPHYSFARTLRALRERWKTLPPDLLVCDSALLPAGAWVDALRQLRLAAPDARFVFLCHQPSFPRAHSLELAALALYDVVVYRADAAGLDALGAQLQARLHQPLTLPDALADAPLSERGARDVTTRRTFHALASPAPRCGVTKAALMLAMYLEDALLVELDRDHPVLEKHVLDASAYDPLRDVYALGGFCVMPYRSGRDWVVLAAQFRHIVLDLGVLPTNPHDPRSLEFLRAESSCLVSTASPWDLAALDATDLPSRALSLWINGCTKDVFQAAQRTLHERFSPIVSLPFQPEWLTLSRAQKSVLKKALSA